MPNVINPMCEVFPKVAGCNYHRYGMGGNVDSRAAICILGLNMINDKVFILVWIWHCLLVFMGCMRIFTRTCQLSSARIRFFLMRMKMHRYFRKNAHMKHIQHYIRHCSIGDWFVLYQMSKNLNKRFFAEFLALLALTVDPDPTIEPDDPEIHLTEKDIETYKNAAISRRGSGSSSSEEEEDDEKPKSPFANVDGLDTELDTSLGTDGPGGSLTGKQRMLIKQGKTAMKAQSQAMKAQMAMRKMKRR